MRKLALPWRLRRKPGEAAAFCGGRPPRESGAAGERLAGGGFGLGFGGSGLVPDVSRMCVAYLYIRITTYSTHKYIL